MRGQQQLPISDLATMPRGTAEGSVWKGVGILTGYTFEVLPVREWLWPPNVGVICHGPGWPYGGGRTGLPEDAFGTVVRPA